MFWEGLGFEPRWRSWAFHAGRVALEVVFSIASCGRVCGGVCGSLCMLPDVIAQLAMQCDGSCGGVQGRESVQLWVTLRALRCTLTPAAEGGQVMNENDSPLLNKTRAMAGWTNATGPLSSDDFEESNKKHEMNGFLFCNTPGLVAPFGRKCAAAAPHNLTSL